MSLKAKTISGLLWTFGQQIGVQGINFIVQIFLARILAPEAFGLIAMLYVFTAIGNSLVDGGMTSSLIRTKELDNRDYSTVFFINIIVSIFVYFVLFISSPLIATFYNQPELSLIIKVYCLVIVIQAFNAVQTTKLTKEMNFKLQMMMQIPATIVAGVCAIFLAKLGYGVWSLVWMHLINTLLFTLQHWIFTKWKPILVFDKVKLKHHFNFGYKLTLSSLLGVLYINTYRILIGKIYSAVQLGYFHQANSLSMFPVNNISKALNKVSYPVFSSLSDNNVRLREAYKQIGIHVSWIICPIMVFLIVFAEPVFYTILTEKWLPAVPYFQILCFSAIFYPHSLYSLNILAAKGRSDLHLKIEVYKKIISILILVGFFKFGVKGIVIAAALGMLSSTIINLYTCSKLLQYQLYKQFGNFLPFLFLSILLALLINHLDNLLGIIDYIDSKLLLLIFNATLFFMIYIVLTILFKMVQVKYFLHNFVKKNY